MDSDSDDCVVLVDAKPASKPVGFGLGATQREQQRQLQLAKDEAFARELQAQEDGALPSRRAPTSTSQVSGHASVVAAAAPAPPAGVAPTRQPTPAAPASIEAASAAPAQPTVASIARPPASVAPARTAAPPAAAMRPVGTVPAQPQSTQAALPASASAPASTPAAWRVDRSTAGGRPTATQNRAPDVGRPAAANAAAVGSPAAPAVASAAQSAQLPLAGVVFCLTGELEGIDRKDAEERIKAAGGKIGSSVSSNTKYLVVGSRLEDGRPIEETSKYRKYLEIKDKGKKCPQLVREAEFLALLPASGRPAAAAPAAAVPAAPAASLPMQRSGVSEFANWVDLHAPRHMGDLVQNGSAARKLSEWLRDWDEVVLRGKTKKATFKPGGGAPESLNARAALLSGPPGIGKTTTARLVAQLHGGYDVLEYNASDARGQRVIQDMAEGIADNMTISFGTSSSSGQRRNPCLTRRACIIMDEVDGMGAGDRGGNAALIKMIKKTRNPIICICNDAHSQKVRSLAFSCYDIRFTRPSKTAVAQRCAEIARRQGLAAEPNALEELAESCGGDMRMVLNQLQALSKSPQHRATGVRYMDMKDRLSSISKDSSTMLSPFDACKKLLNDARRLPFRERLELFFVDYSLVGLLVHENYLRAVDRSPPNAATLSCCAFSADLMTVGDMMNSRISSNQEWSLLPSVGLTTATYPAYVTNGFVGMPSFPQFLGKYSSISRAKRLNCELHAHLRLSASVSVRRLPASGYSQLLYGRALRPLLSGSSEAAAESAALLGAYGLRKEHLQEHLTELRGHLGEEDKFKSVDARVKAAMTREFSSGSHAVKVVIPKGTKRRAAVDVSHLEALEGGDAVAEARAEGEDVGAEDKDSDDDVAGASMVKVKAKSKAKPRGKAKAQTAASRSQDSVAPTARGRARGKAKARK